MIAGAAQWINLSYIQPQLWTQTGRDPLIHVKSGGTRPAVFFMTPPNQLKPAMDAPAMSSPSIKIDKKNAIDLVMQLMAIPGKSGEESLAADFIIDQLRSAGVPASAITADNTHKKSPIGGERGNLIVKLPGTIRGPRRLLMAHIDTVPLCVGARPVRKGNFVTSRDASTALGADDRAGATVVLNTAIELIKQKLPHPPLTLLWPVQEEIGLWGARNASLSKLGNPKLCFNWDGYAAEMVCIGATGDYLIEIQIEGIASHAGVHPEQGVSAAVIAAKAIADLEAGGWLGLVQKGKQAGTSNIGVIEGGAATNVVIPTLSIRAEARSHNPKFRSRIVKEIEQAFRRACRSTKNDAGKTGRIEFQANLKYESFRLDEETPVVQAAYTALKSVGLQGQPRIANGGLDANWLTARGLPTVTFGCGQMNPHTVNETLDIAAFLDACKVALAVATESQA